MSKALRIAPTDRTVLAELQSIDKQATRQEWGPKAIATIISGLLLLVLGAAINDFYAVHQQQLQREHALLDRKVAIQASAASTLTRFIQTFERIHELRCDETQLLQEPPSPDCVSLQPRSQGGPRRPPLVPSADQEKQLESALYTLEQARIDGESQLAATITDISTYFDDDTGHAAYDLFQYYQTRRRDRDLTADDVKRMGCLSQILVRKIQNELRQDLHLAPALPSPKC